MIRTKLRHILTTEQEDFASTRGKLSPSEGSFTSAEENHEIRQQLEPS